jgi:predicted Zn finger-like uncharacterized protein
MFTVCPKCALTLVVTAADLRVAQGYVRCGRCSSVFNALAQLSDERAAGRSTEAPPPEAEPATEPEEPVAARAPAPPAPRARRGAPAEESISEDALEFNPETTDASSVFVAASPTPEWTAATGSFKALVAANQEPVTAAPQPGAPAADEEVDIELDAALLSEIVQSEPTGAPEPPPAPASIPPRAGAPRPGAPPAAPPPAQRRTGHKRPPAEALAAPARTDPAGEPTPQPAAEIAALEEAAPPGAAEPEAARGALLWRAAAGLLALLLFAQIINHERDALATDPRFNRPLTALYAALGVQLMPHWDLHAYDVRQLGATVGQGNGGAITVRASIHNAGPKAQPLPLLRVTLQDRFGNRLASRDVAPRDYLPPSIPPGSLLAKDQRIDAELAFVDPGSSAVGFELDACLPVAGGVACANDASAR